ncbi:hypothetical protein M406DRAFT_68040 [Cryphonectria parasitica EP155]|uniref:C2H2-type domain-containing protein n=1 Tax=Cryphonectria parasitica (strain ATCC 38755 / EP155) TaxID=660469 RepID=A0A9P5CPP1_CRYP1|nr:uncharacterized protein M406DRAFT_68040 [Cryphonectria parasitica EP155]KAF3765617.1 hypothetical protein M406DRAFT_68040 [Cryphonectria parasitica EP155]
MLGNFEQYKDDIIDLYENQAKSFAEIREVMEGKGLKASSFGMNKLKESVVNECDGFIEYNAAPSTFAPPFSFETVARHAPDNQPRFNGYKTSLSVSQGIDLNHPQSASGYNKYYEHRRRNFLREYQSAFGGEKSTVADSDAETTVGQHWLSLQPSSPSQQLFREALSPAPTYMNEPSRSGSKRSVESGDSGVCLELYIDSKYPVSFVPLHPNSPETLPTSDVCSGPDPVPDASSPSPYASFARRSDRQGSPRTSSDAGLSDANNSAGSEAFGSSVDWDWLVDDFELPLTTDAASPFAEFEAAAVQELVASYRTWAQGQAGSQAKSFTVIPTSPQTGDRPASFKRPGQEIEAPTEVDGQGPQVKKRRKQVDPGQDRLACHFQKKNPQRYPSCGIRKNGFRTVAEIKQHFWRKHQRNPNYCPRCKTIFDTEQQKDDHISQIPESPCPKSTAELPEGLPHELVEELKCRVDKEHDLSEQWFSVWDKIFPGIPRPQSPTFDLCGDVHIHALDLAAYLEIEAPRVVSSSLRDAGLLADPSVNIDASTRRVINLSFRRVYQDWLSQRPAASNSPSSSNETSNRAPSSSADRAMLLSPVSAQPDSSSNAGSLMRTSDSVRAGNGDQTMAYNPHAAQPVSTSIFDRMLSEMNNEPIERSLDMLWTTHENWTGFEAGDGQFFAPTEAADEGFTDEQSQFTFFHSPASGEPGHHTVGPGQNRTKDA